MSAAFKLDDLQVKVAQIQSEYQLKIQQAAQNSDFGEMQRLSIEMSEVMQEFISKSMATATATAAEEAAGPTYVSALTDLNLDDYVYSGEKKHYLALINDPVIKPLISERDGAAAFKAVNADLAKTALKIDVRFSPSLKYAVERCQELLKLKAKMQVYVMSSPEMNAFCMPSEEGTVKIGVTSALLEKFNPSEMAFVMGHEIGHALYGHTAINPGAILHSGAEGITPIHVMRLLAWKRSAEVTADRVGLLCGDSFEKSARALFKVSYGFDIHEDEALHHYLSDFHDTEQLMKENIAPEDFMSTHPFGPVRLIALEAFGQSTVFANHVGKPSALHDREALEKRVDAIVSVFESSYLSNPEGLKKDQAEFIFLGGIAIAACDGEVAEAEINALSNLLQRPIDPNEVSSILNGGPEKTLSRLKELASTILDSVTSRQRLMVIKDLCTIAMADGQVMESEHAILVELAGMMQIVPRFIDDVLSGAFAGFD